MNKHGHNVLLNYIDDLIFCGLSCIIHQSYQFLLKITPRLRFRYKYEEVVTATYHQNGCLGILFDTVQHVVEICLLWLQKSVSENRELQSLLGSLFYVGNVSNHQEFCELYAPIS